MSSRILSSFDAGPAASLHPTILDNPHGVSLYQTVRSHGWVDLRPWVWDGEAQRLSRTERLASGQIVSIDVAQESAPDLSISVEGDGVGTAEVAHVPPVVRRWLSLDWDPQPAVDVASDVDAKLATFLRNGGGRLLRGSTFYEDFVKTVCTIQINWAGTKRIVGTLIDEIGGGFVPSPAQVIGAGEDGLREKARLGFRARGLVESTERLLERGLIDEQGNGESDRLIYEELIALRGIGPYAASHLRLLLHDFSRIPIDSEVTKYCRDRLGLASDEIQPFFERWGQYRFLGYRFGTERAA